MKFVLKSYKRSRLFVELILKSWWTILFFLSCLFAYDQAAKRRDLEGEKLSDKLSHLKQEKVEALSLQKELRQEIASQGDESWIELILMKKLGVVPEGQTKVYFVRKNKVQ